MRTLPSHLNSTTAINECRAAALNPDLRPAFEAKYGAVDWSPLEKNNIQVSAEVGEVVREFFATVIAEYEADGGKRGDGKMGKWVQASTKWKPRADALMRMLKQQQKPNNIVEFPFGQ